MITLFSGIPGSGKTYKMVAELSRNKDKYYVVHNIDGLKEGYLGDHGINFIQYCKDQNLEVVDFFSKEYQVEFCAAVFKKYNRPVLAIIDEAHEWFSVNSKNLKMWLSYHRHLDQDIWLVAHRSTNIPAMYRSFIEIEYRAKSGSFIGLPFTFIYNRILGGQQSGYITERKRQEIFDIYKSMVIDSSKKRKKPKIMILMVAVGVLGILLFFMIPQFILKGDAKEIREKEKVSAAGIGSEVSDKIEAEIKSTKFIESNNFADKWAFVGVMAGYVVLEDRQSGEQLPLEKINAKIKMIENDRNNSIVLFLENGSFVTCYNSKRHISLAAKGAGHQSASFAAFNDSTFN